MIIARSSRGSAPTRTLAVAAIVAACIGAASLGALVPALPLVALVVAAAALAAVLSQWPLFLVCAYAGTGLFSDYLSSWLPAAAGYPAGALLRDYFGVAVILAALLELPRSRAPAAAGSRSTRATLGLVALPAALLLVWTVLLVPASGSLPAAILGIRNLLLYPAVALAVLRLVVRGRLDAGRAGSAVLAGLALASVLGILDALTSGASVSLLGYDPYFSGTGVAPVAGYGAAVMGVQRVSGGVSNALVFGYLMALAAVVGADRLYRPRTGHAFVVGVSLFALVVGAVSACYLSLTRGAAIAVVAAAAMLIAKRHSGRVVKGVVVALAIATVAVVVSGTADVIVARLLAQDVSSQVSVSTRLVQLENGLAVLRDNPLGLGLGSQGSASLRFATSSPMLATDNYLLIVGLQLGLPGLVAFLAVLAALALEAMRRSASAGGALMLAMLAVYAVAAALSAAPDSPVFAIPFWLLLALAYLRAGEARAVRPTAMAQETAVAGPAAGPARRSGSGTA